MNSKVNIIWVFVAVLIAGLFGFFTSHYTFFKFKAEIDIVNLVGIILTTGIGLYIASALQGAMEAKNYEKKLFLETLKSVSVELNKLIGFVQNERLEHRYAVSCFKTISLLISDLQDYNEECGILSEREVGRVKGLYFQAKLKVTDAPLKNGTIEYSLSQKSNSRQSIIDLRKEVVSLLIRINRK